MQRAHKSSIQNPGYPQTGICQIRAVGQGLDACLGVSFVGKAFQSEEVGVEFKGVQQFLPAIVIGIIAGIRALKCQLLQTPNTAFGVV